MSAAPLDTVAAATSAPGTAEPVARVALDVPFDRWFDYRIAPALDAEVVPGCWVRVPWGRGRRIGIVFARGVGSSVEPSRLRDLDAVLEDAPKLPPSWLEQVRFVADYYHRGLGEVALPAIPKLLRTVPAARARGSAFERARRERDPAPQPAASAAAAAVPAPGATTEQADALAALAAARGFGVHLLHGVTGSGKTEVYLRWIAARLADDPRAQALWLVPEIGLTPQLATLLAQRFAPLRVAVLHSDLPEAERARAWVDAVEGRARLVVGTRLAVLTPLPALAAIVVDEEHDPSYKQLEGVHYSARDLAVMLGKQRDVPVVLGSATPSLETWHAVQRGRYARLALTQRATGVPAPDIRILDVRRERTTHGLAPAAIALVADTLARQRQALVFLNRRGYAPVLACGACEWVSACAHCSGHRVVHRGAGSARLVCHHCGADGPAPRACPSCGNIDLQPLGRGTQRIEEGLAELFPAARIARLDRDVARRRGAAQAVFDATRAGELDLLVGTQMLAKGHDFARLETVVVVDADGGLYAADFRAPERLFATLLQVAGRAGRAQDRGRVLVQTRFPEHPLFADLVRHDWPGFARRLLAEREAAGLPPFSFQALLRAQARAPQAAIAFLERARDLGRTPEVAQAGVALLDPVPMPMARIAGWSRAQLLVESANRPALHRFLARWQPALEAIAGPVRWQLDVDPLEI